MPRVGHHERSRTPLEFRTGHAVGDLSVSVSARAQLGLLLAGMESLHRIGSGPSATLLRGSAAYWPRPRSCLGQSETRSCTKICGQASPRNHSLPRAEWTANGLSRAPLFSPRGARWRAFAYEPRVVDGQWEPVGQEGSLDCVPQAWSCLRQVQEGGRQGHQSSAS